MKIAVIGRGTIGSAAARHLALAGVSPTLIGPAEPDDIASHQGVFASHYDEGRITRRNATTEFWSEVSHASIERYGEIEASSGIAFFSPVGALMVGPTNGDFMVSARKVATSQKVVCEDLDGPSFSNAFPMMTFSADTAALWEQDGAGHISPRRLVAAQTRAALKAGAMIQQDIVLGLEETQNGVRVRTDAGAVDYDQVLVAAGSMTDHVLGRPVTFEVRPRTVTFFHMSPDQAETLRDMPSAVFDTGHYLLPPIHYPDGTIRMKLGGEPDAAPLTSPGAMRDWFHGGGSKAVSALHQDWFRRHLPEVWNKLTKVTWEPCMTTWSDDQLPEIRRLGPHVSVAAAGNGAGAKCSDELGRRGAALILKYALERSFA